MIKTSRTVSILLQCYILLLYCRFHCIFVYFYNSANVFNTLSKHNNKINVLKIYFAVQYLCSTKDFQV